MRWQDVRQNAIHVVQLKTGEKLWIHCIENSRLCWPLGEKMWQHSANSFERPFTARGFGNFMSTNCVDELPSRCVPHGLRKAAAPGRWRRPDARRRRLRDTGHRTLSEIERYTKAADQKRLAVVAMDRLEAQTPNRKFPNREHGLGKAEKKATESQVGKEVAVPAGLNPHPPRSSAAPHPVELRTELAAENGAHRAARSCDTPLSQRAANHQLGFVKA